MPLRNSSHSYVRYATFGEGELQMTLNDLDPEGKYHDLTARVAGQPSKSVRSRTGLLKEYCCTVHYPDGTEGICQYTREGPTTHVFAYRHSSAERDIDLPRQHYGVAFANTPEAIAHKAQELSPAAFAAAIRRERRDYFCRATEPSDGSRKARPDRYQMSAKRAKEIAGKYALCTRLGDTGKLLPDSPLFDSLEEAYTAWEIRGNANLVIACGNRLDRCWEIPRFFIPPGKAK